MKIILLIFILLYLVNSFPEEFKIENLAPLKCSGPASPLFSDDYTLNLSIISDHEYLNSEVDTVPLLSYLKIENKKEFSYVPSVISTRGRTRKEFCEVKPLRLTFISEDISKFISNNIETNTASILDYYKELILVNTQNNIDKTSSVGISQNNNIFSGLGDDVKIVNHCGKGEITYAVGESTIEKQDQKLLSEYYTYKVLETLNTTTPKVRLANISYINPVGVHIETRKAFFREPRNNIARRCKLNKKTKKSNYTLLEDIVNQIHLELINAFIINYDFEINNSSLDNNIDRIYDNYGLTFYVPYDFDLAVFSVEIFQDIENPYLNRGESFDYIKSKIEEQHRRITYNIDKEINPRLANKVISETLSLFINKKEKMLNIIEESLLNTENKQIIIKRINTNTSIFEQFYKIYKTDESSEENKLIF